MFRIDIGKLLGFYLCGRCCNSSRCSCSCNVAHAACFLLNLGELPTRCTNKRARAGSYVAQLRTMKADASENWRAARVNTEKEVVNSLEFVNTISLDDARKISGWFLDFVLLSLAVARVNGQLKVNKVNWTMTGIERRTSSSSTVYIISFKIYTRCNKLLWQFVSMIVEKVEVIIKEAPG